MFKLFTIILLAAVMGCQSTPDIIPTAGMIPPDEAITWATDTFYIVSADTFAIHECETRADSLNRLLAIERYKVERIKYYVSIVDNNPSQLQFLRGWIKRAVK